VRCAGLCDRTEAESKFREDSSITTFDCTLEDEASLYNVIKNEKTECPTRSNLTIDYLFSLSEFIDHFHNSVIDNCTYNYNNEWIGENEKWSDYEDMNVLINDSYCGFDGVTYCTPSKSSAIFDKYWKICEDDDTIDNKTLELWNYYQERFVSISTAPYCAEDLFLNVSIPNLDRIIDTFSMFLSVTLLTSII
jgi:hypothetical protein